MSGGGASGGERSSLAAAQAGDEHAFVELTSPHRGALHVHCYRMLGSLHDADDAMQETLLRAWRGIGRFEPRAPLAAWLHRIATNVCLRMIEQRRDTAAYAYAHLQPYPDRLLEDLAAPDAGPHDVTSLRESVGLAFVAAMQLLPPKQRAVLVLRDALDWRAREVADLLDDSVPAVNSALQRARERLAREHDAGTLARVHAPASAEVEAAVMRRFQEAWAAVDIDRIVALLTDDAVLTMPPVDMRVDGAAAIGQFFATEPLGGHIERIALVPTRASGQPGFACYADEDGTGEHRAYGVMVFALRGDRIAGITGFPQDTELFEQLGEPLVLRH
ncbi:MAG TPA: RNA polymerase subunit sigma-70 [Solirubrobacteraceae bacterium]|nr:RNA polymerase subunit sigma-70 [Solirubrobacteraceae bacterium]